MPTVSTIVMVPPRGFGYNPETAITNVFQQTTAGNTIKAEAFEEYTRMVASLKQAGITVLHLEQSHDLPDAVFPNNWFSTHISETGKSLLILYPMLTPNRQREVNPTGLVDLLATQGVSFDSIIDLSNDTRTLEGTGSMVFDRDNGLIYAALSPRTNAELVYKIANILDYKPILFHALDQKKRPIYHTNVMMGLGQTFAVVCLESIDNNDERKTVVSTLVESGKTVIEISLSQVGAMCGNVLELFNGQSLLLMSQSAYEHYSEDQLQQLSSETTILSVPIPVIETIGGGSARCMVAEVFPKAVQLK